MITYGLYRILGNDLPPRHAERQTEYNLDYTLKHEFAFPEGVARIFVLNRIMDSDKALVLKRILNSWGVEWFEIPFKIDEYKVCGDQESKVKYLTNLNPARNLCLDKGQSRFTVTMPLDGATFFTWKGWFGFQQQVEMHEGRGVYALSVARVASFEDVKYNQISPDLTERYVMGRQVVHGQREKYLGFGKDCKDRFNEALPYGKVDKAELLWRLGLRGPWDWWEPAIRKRALQNPSLFFDKVHIGGWALRLPNHNPEGDGDNMVRGRTRFEGLSNLVRKADELIA